MKLSNLERINKLSSSRSALISAIDTVDAGINIVVTIPKSKTGHGAQLHLQMTTQDMEHLSKMLYYHLDDTNSELTELGVEL